MNRSKEKVLIAGGTGLIGSQLAQVLHNEQYEVAVLSRNPKKDIEYYWDPEKEELDEKALHGVSVLINLSGASIADERWTKKRKKILEDSRIHTNRFLYNKIDHMPHLRQFICASGINAYAPNNTTIYTETDTYGKDFLPQLVRKWEDSAQLFSDNVKVAMVRTAVVLAHEGGAYPKLSKLTKLGLGSALGKGDQPIPWIHMDDLVAIYLHILKNKLEGTFNAVAANDSNEKFMRSLAKEMNKPFFLPHVPAWILKLALGEMSTLLLDGVCASNEKIIQTGFTFRYPNLKSSFDQLTAASK